MKRGLREITRSLPFVDVKIPTASRARIGYLAGDDEPRARAVERAIASGGLVWALRGGYGATRILDRVDWRRARGAVVVIGYSDLTAILAAVDAAGGCAVSGPMIAADLSRSRGGARGGSKRTGDSLAAFFSARPDRFGFGGRFLRGGSSLAGGILAANLEVLTRLVGTKWAPRAAGRVVFLEEVEEEPYRLDRSLQHLLAAGFFRRARGVVFGSLARCVPETPSRSFSLAEVLDRFSRDVRLPVATGFPFGHGGTNTLLPWNGRVRMRARAGRIETEVRFPGSAYASALATSARAVSGRPSARRRASA